MRRQLATSRRRWGLGALVAAIVVLAVGASQGLAGASGTTVTAPIEQDNFCGGDPGTAVIGSVKLTRISLTTLRTVVRLRNFSPSTNYRVLLQNGDCTFGTLIGNVTTNPSGAGHAVFISSTFGFDSFFVNITSLVCCPRIGESVTVKV